MTRPVRTAAERLFIEVADAWFEYVEATRGQPLPRYEEIEPWAWNRLQRRLLGIEAQRTRSA